MKDSNNTRKPTHVNKILDNLLQNHFTFPSDIPDDKRSQSILSALHHNPEYSHASYLQGDKNAPIYPDTKTPVQKSNNKARFVINSIDHASRFIRKDELMKYKELLKSLWHYMSALKTYERYFKEGKKPVSREEYEETFQFDLFKEIPDIFDISTYYEEINKRLSKAQIQGWLRGSGRKLYKQCHQAVYYSEFKNEHIHTLQLRRNGEMSKSMSIELARFLYFIMRMIQHTPYVGGSIMDAVKLPKKQAGMPRRQLALVEVKEHPHNLGIESDETPQNVSHNRGIPPSEQSIEEENMSTFPIDNTLIEDFMFTLSNVGRTEPKIITLGKNLIEAHNEVRLKEHDKHKSRATAAEVNGARAHMKSVAVKLKQLLEDLKQRQNSGDAVYQSQTVFTLFNILISKKINTHLKTKVTTLK